MYMSSYFLLHGILHNQTEKMSNRDSTLGTLEGDGTGDGFDDLGGETLAALGAGDDESAGERVLAMSGNGGRDSEGGADLGG